jgi:hypothetical protein
MSILGMSTWWARVSQGRFSSSFIHLTSSSQKLEQTWVGRKAVSWLKKTWISSLNLGNTMPQFMKITSDITSRFSNKPHVQPIEQPNRRCVLKPTRRWSERSQTGWKSTCPQNVAGRGGCPLMWYWRIQSTCLILGYVFHDSWRTGTIIVGGEAVVRAERLWWQQLRLSGAAAGSLLSQWMMRDLGTPGLRVWSSVLECCWARPIEAQTVIQSFYADLSNLLTSCTLVVKNELSAQYICKSQLVHFSQMSNRRLCNFFFARNGKPNTMATCAT